MLRHGFAMFIVELSRMPVELQRMLLTILMLAPFLPIGLGLTRVPSGYTSYGAMGFHWALLLPCIGFAAPISFFILYSIMIFIENTMVIPALRVVVPLLGLDRVKFKKETIIDTKLSWGKRSRQG